MAKRKKNQSASVKQIIIVAVILIVLQGAYLLLAGNEPPVGAKQAIEREIKKLTAVDARRKEQLKIQLAVQDYILRNKGKAPDSLDQLKGEYFDSIPIDSKTGKAFSYKVVGGRPIVGQVEDEKPADNTTPAVSQLEAIVFEYDPTNKRDPFRPFDLSPKINMEGKTPLEQYDIGQLKLTAVIGGQQDEPQANIENAARRGFIVKKGTKIGLNNGEVVDIQPDRVLILETTIDFTGEKKTKTIELTLRTKDQEKQNQPK